MKRLIPCFALALALGINQTVVGQEKAKSEMPTPSRSPASISPTAEQGVMTPSDWEKLRNAEQKALLSNPELKENAAALGQKMRDFQRRLDQAILSINPSVAPVVNRIENTSAQRASGDKVSPAEGAKSPGL